MNIFFLDEDPKMCAQAHCDKHVKKMILEYAKMMSTAHRVLDSPSELIKPMYKISQKSHPVSEWVRVSEGNYKWLHDVWFWLCKEYWWRYDKIHEVWEKLYNKLSHVPLNIPVGESTPPPILVPDQYRINTGSPAEDTIQSYRKYYIEEEFDAEWGGNVENMRQPPDWHRSNVILAGV